MEENKITRFESLFEKVAGFGPFLNYYRHDRERVHGLKRVLINSLKNRNIKRKELKNYVKNPRDHGNYDLSRALALTVLYETAKGKEKQLLEERLKKEQYGFFAANLDIVGSLIKNQGMYSKIKILVDAYDAAAWSSKIDMLVDAHDTSVGEANVNLVINCHDQSTYGSKMNKIIEYHGLTIEEIKLVKKL